MNQKIIDGLIQVGLTKTEIKVYLALLDLGESLTGTIANSATLYRKNVYDALSNLHKKGLVYEPLEDEIITKPRSKSQWGRR